MLFYYDSLWCLGGVFGYMKIIDVAIIIGKSKQNHYDRLALGHGFAPRFRCMQLLQDSRYRLEIPRLQPRQRSGDSWFKTTSTDFVFFRYF